MTELCRRFLPSIEERVEGSLDEERERELDRHLEECANCRVALHGALQLKRATDGLRRQVEPSRDLWPGIAARVAEPRPHPISAIFRRPQARFAWGALAAAALALTLGLTFSSRTPQVTPSPASIEASEARLAANAEISRSQDGVMLARQDLLEAIERQKEHLAPETVRVLEENMRIIDQAIGQIRSALDEDPQNSSLNMLLAAQYQREVELLKQISGV